MGQWCVVNYLECHHDVWTVGEQKVVRKGVMQMNHGGIEWGKLGEECPNPTKAGSELGGGEKRHAEPGMEEYNSQSWLAWTASWKSATLKAFSVLVNDLMPVSGTCTLVFFLPPETPPKEAGPPFTIWRLGRVSMWDVCLGCGWR